MRKIFTLFAACLVAMTVMAEPDFSAVCESGQTLYYEITDDVNHVVYVVPGSESSYKSIAGNIIIPAEVEYNSTTYTVKGVSGYTFEDCYSVTGVTFPTAATFTSIGTGTPKVSNSFAFYNTGLTSVVIPDNVTEMGEQVFRGTSLSSVTIGSGLTNLPDGIFGWCSSLKRIVLPNSITTLSNGCFQSSGVKYVELGDAIADGFNARALGSTTYSWEWTKIDTVVINTVTPPTVSGSFYSDLVNRAILYVPVGSKDAYKAADGWKDFKYILEKGEELVTYTISVSGGYSSLEEVSFKLDGVAASSKNFSFKRAEGETFTIQAIFGNPYYGIKKAMFGETDVTDQFDGENKATLTVPAANTTLSFTYEQKTHPYDFAEAVPSGQTLYFKIIDAENHKVAICNQTGGRSTSGMVSPSYDGNTTSPSGAIVIPASITHEAVEYTIEEIDTLAFADCSSITSVTFPDGIKAIRAGAFNIEYSASLGTGVGLVLPQSCTRLEYNAFRGCKYNAVNLGSVEVVEQYAFLYNPLTEIKSTSALRELGQDICKSSALTKVDLGENVEFVSSAAFSECSNLATVTIEATTPPAVKYDPSTGYEATSWSYFNPASATLLVPWSAGHTVLNAYKAANCWKLFGTIAEIPVDPVENLEINFMTNTYTLIAPASLPDGVVVEGDFHDAQHGYSSPKVSIPVAVGNYKFTIGNCTYGNKTASLKNEDESATLNLIDINGQTITSVTLAANCYDQKPAENITNVWFVATEAQTIKICCPEFTPYLKFEKVDEVPAEEVVYTVSFSAAGAEGAAPAAMEVVEGNHITIPANRTLYKAGYTLTGWNDGVKIWVAGENLTPEANVALTAVFAENESNFLEATSELTVQWFLGNSNGAPALNLEKNTGFVVGQATLNEKPVDVKLAIDATKGKCANAGRDDEWAQVNSGTTFTFPSKKGITLAVGSYDDPAGSTLDGATRASYINQVATFSSEEESGSSVLVAGASTYFSYLLVTYPASQATAIEEIGQQPKVNSQKLIVNGQLLIMRDGRTFNALGVEIK